MVSTVAWQTRIIWCCKTHGLQDPVHSLACLPSLCSSYLKICAWWHYRASHLHTSVHVECYMVVIALSCSSMWHLWMLPQQRATTLYLKCCWHKGQMCSTKHTWVTLGSGTHNLIQHSTHDTNHVHRVHSLPFTLLPMVDPLSVSSTCCLSLETGSLRWMCMVGHAFTMQFWAVASQWWGTSWTSVDLTSAWEMMWSLLKPIYMIIHAHARTHAHTHPCMFNSLKVNSTEWPMTRFIYLLLLYLTQCMSVLALHCLSLFNYFYFSPCTEKKQSKTYTLVHTYTLA